MGIANAWMDEFAVQLVAPKPGDSILEIGFGPGVAIRTIGRDAPDARVSGIDSSEVMLRQAVRRNRAAVRQGRADLRLGSVVSLPWPDHCFDCVLSLNSAHFWDPVDQALSECHRVLRPRGRVVIGFHIWRIHMRSSRRLNSLDDAEAFLNQHLTMAGFAQVEVVRRPFPMGTASFLIGTRR